MTLRSTAWSDQDDDKLRAMIASGASSLRCAAAFNRKVAAIRAYARKIGSPFPSDREVRSKMRAKVQAAERALSAS